MATAGLAVLVAGCEVNGFLDPTAVGRFQSTPAILPILDQLDAVDVAPPKAISATPVRDEDLVAQVQEYQMGPGDVITVTVYELLQPGMEYTQTRRINELGYVTLPEIGKVKAGDTTASALEDKIADILRQSGKLKEPSVSVLVQEPHYNTWSLVGESGLPGVGTYNILSKNFRLLDAIALARGVSSQVKTIYVIRQVSLTAPPPANQTGAAAPNAANPAQPVPKPEDLLRELLPGVEPNATQPQTSPAAQTQAAAPPTGMEAALEPGHEASPWAYINGKWVKTQEPGQPAAAAPTTQGEAVTAQRVIEIPVEKLLAGDPKYNIVIRPGDIVQVPSPTVGNVYVMGQANRPGVYGLTSDGLTLKNLIAAAGNFAPLAVPARTDIIRRFTNGSETYEVTVRVNLKAIFNGTQPDIFLKPNDTVNIGTNLVDYFAQVFRNGFRTTYGFGFTIDRSFDTELFGPIPQSINP
jgi:polysaccharide export outer membrane protein